VIVRVHETVIAFGPAKDFSCAIGKHLIHVHVVRGAGTSLVDVDHELIAKRPVRDLVGGFHDCFANPSVDASELHVGSCGGFLDEDGCDHQMGRRPQPADREILNGTRSLDAVVRVGRNRVLAERIVLDAGHGWGSRLWALASRLWAAALGSRLLVTSCSNYTGPMLSSFFDSVLSLIVRTSTDLPPDVRAAMKVAMAQEQTGTQSSQALTVIAQNIDLAADGEGAICQDTGMPTFEVKTPVGVNQLVLKKQIRDAIAEATKRGKLRPNSVDSLTGANSGNNLGPGTPIMHVEQWENDDEIEVKLILKGGGCENMNAQYSLPAELSGIGRADRSIEGVRKCILHAVWHAQGKGCAPGAIGVCIGGDRTSGYVHAKEQLFRTLDDVNPDSRLAALESSIMGEVNKLGIGAMGFGGRVSLIGCKVGALNRLPASFFVSVAYDCWAYRRLGVVIDAQSGDIKRWLYRDGSRPVVHMADQSGFPRTGREIALRTPITEEQVRSLKVGDVVLLSGRAFTGRDAVHHHLMKHDAPVDLRGGVIYHCGPVVAKEGGGWRVTAAGPTTSIREEPYQADVIARNGVRMVIGKGGMGTKTLAALQKSGAVYLNAIGGAAQFYARTIKSVDGVSLMEFGTPEAMWHLTIEDFPAIVTMDAHGNSLHKDVEQESAQALTAIGG
jgi:fumarate hydratase, class I